MHQEASFYNAIAIALRGDQRIAADLRRRHASWADAYHALAHARLFPLPDPGPAAEALLRAGVDIVLSTDGPFPGRLREIPHAPLALYIKGSGNALAAAGTRDTLAIIGTRRASPEGKAAARHFGAALAGAGAPIVSGLAFGIDAAAHEGCLTVPDCIPLAVLAGGLEGISPRTHEHLARRIVAAGGALVSEYPLTEAPLPRRFIERNRIVSGLARGAVIIEAPEGSGALSTARFALEQNRDVFVLPGAAASPSYRGSHRLIQQGAALVISPEDIMENYGMVKEQRAVGRAGMHGDLSPDEMRILSALADTEAAGGPPLDVDKISSTTKLEPRIVNQTLTFLLLKDLIREERGGYAIQT